MMAFICGRLDSVMSASSAIIYVISSSISVSFDRFSKSIHFDYTSPLLRTYSRVIPGGKYRMRIFLSFIFKLSFYISKLQ